MNDLTLARNPDGTSAPVAMTGPEILHAWYDRFLIAGDLTAIGEMFAPDAHPDGLMPDTPLSADEFYVMSEMLLALITPVHYELHAVIENGPLCSAIVRIVATREFPRRQVSFDNHITIRHDGTHILEAHNAIDFISLFEALDLMPPETLALCLSGTGIQ